ncbi:MAG: glycosyltransferase family 1 protein [Pseudomonadota bacterium]
MPPILIDVTRLVGRAIKGRLPTGVDRVMLEYVRHYGADARAVLHVRDQFRALSASGSQRLFGHLLGAAGPARKLLGLLLRDLPGSAGAAAVRGAVLLNLGHGNLHRASHQRTLARHGIKPVYFIHDLIPISHPEYCRAGEGALHAARMAHALEYGAGIIANSAATLAELAAFARQHGLRVPAAVVALLAPATAPVVAAGRPLSAPYFVMLGTIEARKNHWIILQAWRQLVQQLGQAAPKLVVIGQRGWECEQVFDLLDRCAALRGAVIEMNSCGDDELARYLRHAQALLFPSFAEGFGMPLVEALQMGTPVIASDLPAFREIAGAVPDYLDPLDGTGWKRLVEAYCAGGNGPRADQLARLAGYRVPAWPAHFAAVDPLLEQLR